MIKEQFTDLWGHFSARRKKQILLVFFLMIISSFAEVLSLSAVMPFLGALSAPDKVIEFINSFLCCGNSISNISYSLLLISLAIVFIISVLISILMRFLYMYAATRLAHGIGAELSLAIFRQTLYLPYSTQCSRNSAQVIAAISSKVNVVVYSILIPTLTIATSVFLIVAILGTLFFIEPYAALTAFLSFSIIYFVTIRIFHSRLAQTGRVISKESGQIIKVLQESIGGIKDILINRAQQYFIDAYVKADLPLRQSLALSQVIGSAPRYIIEALGVVVLALVALQLAFQSEGIMGALPVLGAMALGGQKLLPIMQNCFSSWSQIQSGRIVLGDILEMLNEPTLESVPINASLSLSSISEIEFRNISYRYPDTEKLILKNISFSIKPGEKIGVVGRSGSGKSTLVDLLMGLLIPVSGNIYVNKIMLSQDGVGEFQKLIAHVPQDIFMVDGSVAENIAFGIPKDKIDYALVKQSAVYANLSEVDAWSSSYDTSVGERGALLSGGQKQRIGIARALYRRAKLIVFDEATSALDGKTEKEVIDYIGKLPKEIIVIFIAHRLNTLKTCDRIFEINGGVITFYDNYNAYMKSASTKLGI